jgi:IclR helix-turn-helix domain
MSKDKVEAVERALAVLNAFHADKPTMTLGEIASGRVQSRRGDQAAAAQPGGGDRRDGVLLYP